MTDLTGGATAPASATPGVASKLYFAIWRWHFYSGLYVIPFLLMLSATGALILWFTAVAPEYGDRLAVTPAAGCWRPASWSPRPRPPIRAAMPRG